MGTIRLVGGKHRVEVRRKDFYRSGNFESRMEAKAADARWEAEYQVKVTQGFEPHALGAAIVKYTHEISAHKKGKKWEETRAKYFLKNEPLLCAKLMHEISVVDFDLWMQKRSKQINPLTSKVIAGSTINRDLNWLSAVFNAAVVDWKWCGHNIIRDLRRPKDPPARDRRLSDLEIDRILAVLNKQTSRNAPKKRALARMFLVAIETGMRLGELCALRSSDVFLNKQYVRLHDSKNGQGRDVPLTQAAASYIGEQLALGCDPLFDFGSDTASSMFQKAVKEAELVDLHFHDTRHEAITRLARKIDVLDLARMVGHRDINSLRRYYNATASEIAARLG